VSELEQYIQQHSAVQHIVQRHRN